MPSQLERSQQRFRRALLAQDARSRAALRRSYQASIRTLTNDLRATLAAIDDLRARGEDVPLWRLLAENRARQLIARAEAELARYADVVERVTLQAQEAAIRQAEQDAIRLIEESFGTPPPGASLPIHALPTAAIRELTAQLQPDAPVRHLLEGFAGDAVESVQDAITGGIAAGQSPAQITRAVTTILGSQARTRAERIVRTEAMRAYREASRATYVENKHLMTSWIWFSATNARTCAVCWALHGREFDVETKMATHPNCRCVLMPKTKSWKDLGYDVPDNRPKIETGPELFAKLSTAEQRAVLGPQAFSAYRSGSVALEDFVGQTRSDIWGSGRRRVSLQTAQAKADKFRNEFRQRLEAQQAPARSYDAPFQKFASRDEAFSWFEAEGIAISELEPGMAGTKVLNHWAEGYHNLRAQGFDLPKKLSFGRSDGTANVAAFRPLTQGIEVNLDHGYWKSPAKWTKEQYAQGWWASGDPLSLVYHEVGHFLQGQRVKELATERFGDFKTFISSDAYDPVAYNAFEKQFTGPLNLDDRELVSRNVSRYGATNTAEFVAETFAAQVSKSDLTRIRSMSPELADLYERSGGPRIPKSQQARKAS